MGPATSHWNLRAWRIQCDAGLNAKLDRIQRNWCAFVHHRVVTTAVSCGTEKYTIKSQSPCPNGTPDCQLIMYKLSTRPVYRQQQKIFTALLWRCCPGHGGQNCEETVADGHVSDSGNQTAEGGVPGASGPSRAHHAGPERLMQLAGDRNWEQNDFQVSGGPPYEADHPERELRAAPSATISDFDLDLEPTPEQDPNLNLNHNHNHNHGHDRDHYQEYDHDREHRHKHDHDQDQDHEHNHEHDPEHDPEHDRDHGQTGPFAVDMPPGASPTPDAAELLPLGHVMEALMARLQPVLDGFNRSLERLSQEVGGLSRDLAQLKEDSEARGAGGDDFEAKLEDSFHQIDQVRELLGTQRGELEERLHSQQVALQYNLTNFKTSTDVKIKHSQKTVQVNIQALNASLAELKQEQERLGEELRREGGGRDAPSQNRLMEGPAVWEAIARLDNKVVNNTVKVNALLEDLDLASSNIRDLQRGFRGLEDSIEQTGRNSQIQFMETGLEVEAAKVQVLNRVNELASNLSVYDEHLREIDSDVDYLYQQFYKNTSASDCNCKALTAALARLEEEVANATELANENRLALEESAEGQDRWEVGWGTSVDDLKQGLLQVQESLAFEQDKSRSLTLNVSQLRALHAKSEQDIRGLQERDEAKASEMRRLASSFSSLLKDAIRHTDVLEVLIGEEVLGFKEKPLQEQEEYSIPLLRKKILQMQDQITSQNLSPRSAQPADPALRDEASILSEWDSRGLKQRSGDHRHSPDSPMGDRPGLSASNFWSLEKEVEDLGAQVSRLEQQRCLSCCNCTGNAAPGGAVEELQDELALLRRGLEDHIRVFKNIFSNMDSLAGSEGTLDLDKLWALMKKKEGRKQRRRQKEKNEESHSGRRDNLRSKRDASLETAVLTQMSDPPLMFLAGTNDGANDTGIVIFEQVSLNRGQMYSPKSGTFRAPAAGVYLFVLTVDFGPGPALAYLKRGEAMAATMHHNQRKPPGPMTRVCVLELERGEQVHFELSQGTVEHSNQADNTFAGLLLFRNT
ncbi:hypothetical protein MATL_G00186520 [Megalops atlanticus]|uniref:Multimerin-2 n=1 Tax=Megalops atlanticus TaxID=7932 RepID=A0A9D3PPE0_MEGAT|nr:hypothetical protein MATL_G00186520 [Megalops atlanticus]